MPGGGSTYRRGGRQKGTPNKRTEGRKAAEAIAAAQARQQASQGNAPDENIPTFDSLALKRRVTTLLMAMVADEHNKRISGQKWDPKWMKDVLEAADRAINALLPYEHRRLATLEPAMETVVKPDGSVHITINKGDADL